jgi:hypothetical protein
MLVSVVSLCFLQEDWEADSKRVGHPSDTKTKLMDARESHGLAAFEAKPEGVDAIGYGMFFNSMFDLADSMVGRGQEGPLSKHGIALFQTLQSVPGTHCLCRCH